MCTNPLGNTKLAWHATQRWLKTKGFLLFATKKDVANHGDWIQTIGKEYYLFMNSRYNWFGALKK